MAYLLDSGLALGYTNAQNTNAIRASGGAPGSTSVVISAANPNIAYDQTITGTGLAPNTKVISVSGTTVNFSPAATGQVSGVLSFTTNWYKLTDHNRQPIQISTTLIEKESRMANGTMRKFVVAKKDTISASWENVPTSSVQAIPYSVTSATVASGTIIYATSSNHNFALGSIVKISGFTNDKLNITGSVINKTSNTFQISNSKFANDGTTTAPAISEEVLPSITTVDGNKGAAWLSAFYNSNSGIPVYLKVVSSKMTDPSIGRPPSDSTFTSARFTSKIYYVFMTNFSQTITKRTRTTDYVDMNIEFTEI